MKSPDSLSIAGSVHDLNNVLQTLMAVALQTEDEVASAAILRSVECARHILSELQNGRASLQPLSVIVANAAAFVKDHSGTAVELVTDIESRIELPAAWDRVLINLFLNSVRAMPRGGTIRVTARHTASSTEILVADEGCGIPHEVRDRLFEPHVSTHGSSGLGLNIVDTIVKASGGSVVASNGENGGAVFKILLPTARRAANA